MEVQDVTRLRDVPRQGELAQVERLLLQQEFHFLLAELARQAVVLHDGEVEEVALAEEERARLRMREPSPLAEDALEQDAEVALARERDADLHQLFEGVGQIERRRFLAFQRVLRRP